MATSTALPLGLDGSSFRSPEKTVYYRGRELLKIRGRGVRGNFVDETTGEEYWISGVKRRGSNTHGAESIEVKIDPEALDAYRQLRAGA